MGVAQVRLRVFELFQLTLEARALAQATAQQRVDKSTLRTESQFAGQLDRIVDRRVIGDAVEPEELVQAKPQQDLQELLLSAPGGLARDEPIESGLPAHH